MNGRSLSYHSKLRKYRSTFLCLAFVKNGFESSLVNKMQLRLVILDSKKIKPGRFCQSHKCCCPLWRFWLVFGTMVENILDCLIHVCMLHNISATEEYCATYWEVTYGDLILNYSSVKRWFICMFSFLIMNNVRHAIQVTRTYLPEIFIYLK